MSSRFRKKPIEVEAMRYFHDGSNLDAILEFGGERVRPHVVTDEDGCSYPTGRLWVETRVPDGQYDVSESRVLLNPGTWLIRGVLGELYPCPDAVFLKTYENANAEQPSRFADPPDGESL